MGRPGVAVHLLTANESGSSTRPASSDDSGAWRDLASTAGIVVSAFTRPQRWSVTSLARERLVVGADDDRFFSDFSAVLGGSPAAASPDAGTGLTASVLVHGPIAGWGHFTIARDGIPIDARAYFIGLDKPDCPYLVEAAPGGWTVVLERNATEPALLFRGADVVFRLVDVWPVVALSFLFRAAFGVHTEAILFHAGSVEVFGRGFMFTGPRRAGKSTLSTALASRGHHFLGDEIAWYLPETHELIDFRRPVGVREGVHAAAIDDALTTAAQHGIEWHDSLRVPIDLLVPQQRPRSVTLHSVFFLRDFEPEPRLVPVRPTLEHAQALQPIMVSLLNVSAGRRLLQMTRLLSAVRVYDLYPGHPDSTATFLEEVARHGSHGQ